MLDSLERPLAACALLLPLLALSGSAATVALPQTHDGAYGVVNQGLIGGVVKVDTVGETFTVPGTSLNGNLIPNGMDCWYVIINNVNIGTLCHTDEDGYLDTLTIGGVQYSLVPLPQ